MSGPILVERNPSHRFEPITSSPPDMFAQMEATQAKVDQRKMEADLTPTALKNVPISLQKQALAVVDEICEKTGQESITRRLAKLMARVAEATERHIFRKKEEQQEKKVKIGENLELQQEWKSYQAWTQCGGGFGSAFLGIAGNLVGGPIGQLLTSLTQLTPSAAASLSTWIDSKQLPLQHEQQFFIQTIGADRQAIEGFKNLPKEMQQLIQRLLDLELQAYRAVTQR